MNGVSASTAATTTRLGRLYVPNGTTASPPFDLLITPESAGWGYCSLRVVTLSAGESVQFATESDEMIVLPLSGDAEVSIGDTIFALAGRESMFTAVTDTAYLPINSQVRLSSRRGGRIALPGARGPGPAVQVPTGLAGRRLAAGQWFAH